MKLRIRSRFMQVSTADKTTADKSYTNTKRATSANLTDSFVELDIKVSIIKLKTTYFVL